MNLFSFFVPVAHAVDVTITTSIPGVTENSPQGIVSGFYTFALMIGGLLAFAAIVYGGIRYTLAAGDTSSQSDARDRITQALVGLLLLLGAFIVLYTVNPNLTKLGLPTLDKISVPAGGTFAETPPGAQFQNFDECDKSCPSSKQCVFDAGTKRYDCKDKAAQDQTYGCPALSNQNDINSSIVWLCADSCNYLKGQCLTTYGGCSAIPKSKCGTSK